MFSLKKLTVALNCLLIVFLFAFACTKSDETGTPEPAPTPFTVTITTATINNVTAISAQSGGSIQISGNGTIKAKGICWGTSATPTTTNNKAEAGSGPDAFTISLSGLTSGTTYYARSFATDDKGNTYYGNEVTFTTQYNVQVTTAPITIKSTTSAEFAGSITVTGGESLKSRGFCYGTSPQPTVANTKIDLSGTTGNFTSLVQNLSAQNTYYVRAFAIAHNDVIFYGNDVTFKTESSNQQPPSNQQPSSGAITVTTSAATSVTTTNAVVSGSVTNTGLGMIGAKGICWGTTSNPTVSGTKTMLGGGTGSFQSTLTGLQPNTKYYARAWAWDESQSVTYGNEITFTTPVTNPVTSKVTVTTSAATATSSTGATTGGTVTIEGLETVTSRGVCYSTSANPTTSSSKTSNGSGAGTFTSTLSGLNPGTKYYVKAYAISGSGSIQYGNEISFTTTATTPTEPPPAQSVPPNPSSFVITATVPAATDISNTGFKVPISFKDMSTVENVAAFGVLWHTIPLPATYTYLPRVQVQASLFAGKTEFSDLLQVTDNVNIKPNTKYYLRAVAVTDKGNAYMSDEISFYTSNNFSITTGSVQAQYGNIFVGGDFHNGATERYSTLGAVYSTTNQNPTVADSKIGGISITSLNYYSLVPTTAAGITYYVRAYATTNLGRTLYGEVKSVTSLAQTAPTPTPNPSPSPSPSPSPNPDPTPTPPPSTEGSRNSCLTVTEKGQINNCTNGAFSVKVTNTNCTDKIDIRIILKKKNGQTDAGLTYGVAKGASATYWTCDGTGEFQIQSRTAGSTAAFPPISNSWQR